MANLGIPTKLLHESLGHIVSVELKTGAVYRGKLFDGKHFFNLHHMSMLPLPYVVHFSI